MAKKESQSAVREIRKESKRLLESGTSVSEFSSRFFGPNGMLRSLWTTDSDRKALVDSEIYRELQAQLASIRAREAAEFESEIESASGRLTVVVPKSLHAALRLEAEREGISLSELIRMKLGVPYRLTARMMLAGRGDSEAA